MCAEGEGYGSAVHMTSMDTFEEFMHDWWVFILAGVIFLGALAGGCIWYVSENGAVSQHYVSPAGYSDAELRELPLEELESMYAFAAPTVDIDAFGTPTLDQTQMMRIGSAISDVRKKESSGN